MRAIYKPHVLEKGEAIPGYVKAVMSRAIKETKNMVFLSDQDYEELRHLYSRYAYTPGAFVTQPAKLSLAQKVSNFAASAARHVAAGMPQATEEEVARRFAICEGCEHFDGKACRQCGCPVVREKKFLSKLSWAGESCPVGKWGPAAD